MARTDLQAMCRLVDSLGADVLLNLAEPMPKTRAERVSERLILEQDAAAWHERFGCACQPNEHEPVMPEWADSSASREGSIAVIGPCPTHGWKQSRSERLVYDALRRSGIAMGTVTWLHACWCVPLDAKGQVRPPTVRDTKPWHGWLLRALEAADCEYVLLHGAQAVRAWRPDVALNEAVGSMQVWANRWWTSAIPHASNVTRRDGMPEKDWREQVGGFAQSVIEGVTWEGLASVCVKCDDAAYMWDADGVAYCKRHLAGNLNKRETARKNRAKSIQQTHQGELRPPSTPLATGSNHHEKAST